MEEGLRPYPCPPEGEGTAGASIPGGVLILSDRDGIVAVCKPGGMASIPDRAGSPGDLHSILQEMLGTRLFVVHRLDRGTSGVILFARTAEVHRTLSIAFQSGGVAKTYHAAALGCVDECTITAPLRRFGSGRVWADPLRGKPSTTSIRVLERGGGFSLVEAHPLTGRQHQIRAHLAFIGHPVAGDPVYSRASCAFWPRLMLHASKIELVSFGNGISFEAPIPGSFTEALERARSRAGGGSDDGRT